VPPKEVQELRALLAQRNKMIRLRTQAKNRMHAILHRHHIVPPPGDVFDPKRQGWMGLPLGPAERTILQSDLGVLAFAEAQIACIGATLKCMAARDERASRLVHLPGINLINFLTILAAIGAIDRFPDSKQLVGYSGLGGRVHASGQTYRTGRITKAGRRDLRTAMVETAQTASNTHPHWRAELARLEPRLGRIRAIVAIARKLLVAVWHILAKDAVDRFAEPEIVARKLMQYSYVLGKVNRPTGQSSAQFVRLQLESLGLGAELAEIPWGAKKPPLPLPPSKMGLEEERAPSHP